MAWKNPLPGVPPIESPFFEEWLRESELDDETKSLAVDLRRDGYVVFDFPDDNFDELRDEVLHDIESITKAKLAADKKTGISPVVLEMDFGYRVQDGWAMSKAVRSIACNPRILELLNTLYGRRGWPFQTLNFTCGTQQPYHSDSVHFSSVPERFMCGVWVALEDIDADNGPLVYYPGSHQWPIYGNEHVGNWTNAPGSRNQETHREFWDRNIELQGLERREFHAKKGQALIWLSNLLHGGDIHHDPERSRWSQVTHYYFDDCAYITPVHTDAIYGNTRFRHPTDISTGERIENRYLGRKIPEEFINSSFGQGTLEENLQRFDPERYLKANPDVREAGVDPRRHFIEHGFKERRPF